MAPKGDERSIKKTVADAGRTGRAVTFLKTSRGIFPTSVLKTAAKGEKGSRQVEPSKRFLRADSLVPFPFSVKELLELQANCSYFANCTRTVAQDVAGSGFVFESKDPKKKLPDKIKADLEAFFTGVNAQNETPAAILERAIDDLMSIGWAGIEVAREGDNPSGPPVAIFHIPAHTLYFHDSETKYCQVRGQAKAWFKPFGATYDIDCKTGKEGGEIPADRRANEVIFTRRYSRLSDLYGEPPILPGVGAVMGMIGVRDYNLSFFENYGVPACLITIEGRWEEGTADAILKFMSEEIRGTENAHRTMVLEVPDEGKVEMVPLSTEIKEGSFRLIRKDHRDEILAAYKMPPYRIGIAEVGALGGSTAPESTKIYNSAMIAPLKRDLAAMLTATLIRDGMGFDDAVMKFQPMDLRNLDAAVERWSKLFAMGVINAEYIAQALGDVPTGEPHMKTYYVSNQYVEAGEALPTEKRDIEAEIAAIHGRIQKRDAEVATINKESRALIRSMADRVRKIESKALGDPGPGRREKVAVGKGRTKE